MTQNDAQHFTNHTENVYPVRFERSENARTSSRAQFPVYPSRNEHLRVHNPEYERAVRAVREQKRDAIET